MDAKTKLYVFAKKEVALIFIFMILIAITSFVLGIKIGKNYSLELAGITKEDHQKVSNELLSAKEEELQAIKSNPESSTVESSEIENKLQEKINSEFGEGAGAAAHGSTDSHGAPATPATPTAATIPGAVKERNSSGDGFSGKFTIQLGSHRTLKEAEAFAEGFRARGYNPIINQVEIKGKGTWYRVSLEAFDTEAEAKAYIAKEKTLFMGQDYHIIKMP